MNDEELRARFASEMLPLLDEAHNLAWWLLKNDEDARDAVQEAYLRAFRFFRGYHGESGRAWLLKIVRNVCLNFVAARVSESRVFNDEQSVPEVEDTTPPAWASLAAKGTVEAVRAAILTLPLALRATLVLREMDGLTYKEIAEVTEVPIGTVMSRLARARQQLGTILLEERRSGHL
jgi:RNA polymerase sigma-70 factor, ECF subfamily